MEISEAERRLLSQVLELITGRSPTYKFCVQVTVLWKRPEGSRNLLTKLDFNRKGSEKPPCAVFDYQDVAIVKQVLSLDGAASLIKTLATEGLLKVGGQDEVQLQAGLRSQGTPSRLLRSEWSLWPVDIFVFEPVDSFRVSAPYISLAAPDAPYYPSLDYVLQEQFGVRTQNWWGYFSGQVVIILPDFRARISTMTIAQSQLRADCECVSLNPSDLVAQIHAENRNGVLYKDTVHPTERTLQVDLSDKPTFASIALLSRATREMLDEKRYLEEAAWREPGVIVEGEEKVKARDHPGDLLAQGLELFGEPAILRSLPKREGGVIAEDESGKKAGRVFVVHGRDERLRSGMFALLRAIGLDPIEWSKAIALTRKASPYIGEVLGAAFKHAQAVVALLTPDDEARLRPDLLNQDDPPYEKILTGQPRPNVLFEAGMAFASHQDKTVLVQIGTVRPFSDVAGRHVVHMDGSVGKRQELAQRLRTAGCAVDLTGTDWHSVGDLTPPPTMADAAANAGQEQDTMQEDILVTFVPVAILPDALGNPMQVCLVKAVNKGKKPVSIEALGLQLSDGGTFNPQHLRCYSSSNMPAKLFESDGLSAWMLRSDVPMDKVKCAFARANDGTVYKSEPVRLIVR